MKSIPMAFALLMVASPVLAVTIPATDAAKHVGQTATVEGEVRGVHRAKYVTFINMGGRDPNHAFTAVVFKSDSAAVGDVSGLEGQNISVTGVIKLYKGKPEIVVKSKGQVTILSAAH
jgi:DNA/RNA endonuclease YhcR with UshA esterase domain